MSYKEKFLALNPSEFEIALEENDGLNSSARHAMKEILEDRGQTHTVPYQEILDGLAEEEKKIRSLKYLKNMGFTMFQLQDSIVIKRYTWSNFIDVVGILLGLIFMFALVPAVQTWRTVFTEGLTSGGFFMALIVSGLGVVGIGLLSRSLIRFTELRDFKLVIRGKNEFTKLELFKRMSWKRQYLLLDPESITYEEDEEGARLVTWQEGRKIHLFQTEGAYQTRETLKLLKEKYLS